MGKRKSRQTAKTGDTNLYASRSTPSSTTKQYGSDDDDDDGMYNEVDRYHNKKEEEEFLKFDSGEKESEEEEDDGVTNRQESVFDLGIGGSSSSSSEEEEESSDDDSVAKDDSSSSSDDDDADADDDELEKYRSNKSDLQNWGSRKRDYYSGDTADIEASSSSHKDVRDVEEDAELEEEAGKEVIKARYEVMDEDDFMLSGNDNDDDDNDDDEEVPKNKKKQKTTEEDTTTILSTSTNRQKTLEKLSKSEKLKLLKKDEQHSELLPLVEYFRDGCIMELMEKTGVVCDALVGGKEDMKKKGVISDDAKAVGATKSGIQYILTKSLLQTSTALNICLYLLLKSEQSSSSSSTDFLENGEGIDNDIKNHPVIARLNQLNEYSKLLTNNVEDKVEGLSEQIENLVKAAKLMVEENENDMEEEDGTESSNIENEEKSEEKEDDEEDVMMEALLKMKSKKQNVPSSSSSSEDSEEDDDDEEEIQRRVTTEARFAIRPHDISSTSTSTKEERKRRRVAFDSHDDFGDDDDDNNKKKKASGALASTMNTIAQKSATKHLKLKTRLGVNPEDEDLEDDDALQRGLAMMEADIGGGDEEEEDEDISDGELKGSEDEDEDRFYKQIQKKSKSKKEYKKSLYEVAPKYPNISDEITGERAIGRAIMKNRGLVAHKSKLNRNPRVKKREQYRKALIRRRGAVRDVRTDEGHRYGGEETGIKSGLSRSRKLR